MENLKRDLIRKYIGNWSGLKKSSIHSFADTGKISGSFLIALEEMMEEYHQTKLRLDAVGREVCELREWDGGDETNLCDCGKGEGYCKRMEEKISITDRIDGILFDLPFEDKIKCWELIEDLIQERIIEFCTSNVGNSICGKCKHYKECSDLLPPDSPPCKMFEK